MNKRLLAFVILLLTVCVAPAQNKDSLAFVNGPWKTRIIHWGGIKLRQCAFTDSSLFRSNQFVSILEVRNSFRFDIVADSILVLTEDFVAYSGALAGINGSFFALDAPWNSVDYLRVDNRDLAPNQIKENRRLFHQTAAIAVSNKGKLSVYRVPDSDMETAPGEDWERSIVAEDVLTSGPLLRFKGENMPLLSSSFYTTRHPRTALGIRRGGRVLMVVVDGRATRAAGMSLEELQQILKWIRAYDAVNLDGGGSSTLCVRKNATLPVQTVNHPSDNKQFDALGARRVANAIVVK